MFRIAVGLLILLFVSGAQAANPFPEGCPPGSGSNGWIEVGRSYDRCGNPIYGENETEKPSPPLRNERSEEVLTNLVALRPGDTCQGENRRILYDSGTREWVCATVKRVIRKLSNRRSR